MCVCFSSDPFIYEQGISKEDGGVTLFPNKSAPSASLHLPYFLYNPVLDMTISVCLPSVLLRHACATPPWIFKQGILEMAKTA